MICGKNSFARHFRRTQSTDRSIGATHSPLQSCCESRSIADNSEALAGLLHRSRRTVGFLCHHSAKILFFAVRCCCSSLDLVVLNMLLFLLSLQS